MKGSINGRLAFNNKIQEDTSFEAWDESILFLVRSTFDNLISEQIFLTVKTMIVAAVGKIVVYLLFKPKSGLQSPTPW